jgi:hypothetical protein
MPGPLFTPVLPGAGFPAQDYIVIAGLPSPGKVTILAGSGASPRGWDERAGYAQTGATLVPTGDKLATIKMRFEFWDPNDLAVWKAFCAKFFTKSLVTSPAGGVGLALSIDHPILKFPPLNLSSFVFLDCTPLTMSDETGLWSQEIEFKQYRKPQPALQKPPAAIPDIGGPKPTAQDALDAELAAKAAELAALAGP